MMLADLTLTHAPVTPWLVSVGVTAAIVLGLVGMFAFATNRRIRDSATRGWLSRLCYAVFLTSVGVLAISSFGSLLQFGHMSGYALLAHVAAAGAFVFLLLVVAVLYLPWGGSVATDENTAAVGDQRWWFARWTAWLLVISSLLTAGSMFLSMLPILDTAGLHEAVAVHRWTGLVVVVSALFHLFAISCTRLGWR